MYLCDETSDISQSHIESTVYFALAGTHIGLIPKHFAEQWVKTGELVAIAPETYGVTSHFNAVRLKSAPQSETAALIWDELGLSTDA